MTTAELLIATARRHGFAVTLESNKPVLKRVGSGTLPQKLLNDLKLHRNEIVRHLVIASLLLRTLGHSIWGYDSRDGRAHKPYSKKGIPGNWDRICVEGDKEWLEMPRLSK